MSYYAGIDLGTSSVKVVISDVQGKVLSIGQQGYPVDTPYVGYAEQDPEAWWSATVAAIQKALGKKSVTAEDIQGIGFSGQMHGMVALKKDGSLACQAIIWMDQRTGVEKDEIKELAGELLTEELLNQPNAGMLICSLYWLKKHQPKIYEEIDTVMLPKDYIRYRLSGRINCDISDASSTLAFSVKNRCWCCELIRRLELKETLFPPVVFSTDIVGTVSKKAAEETGFSVNTKVVAGGADAAMQLLGNGMIEEGTIVCNIGTASQIVAFSGQPVYDPQMRMQTWCHAFPNAWYIQGGALNGGSTLSWLRAKAMKSKTEFSVLAEEAGKIPAGSEGLFFLPYLAGERTPFQNPDAKGVFFGLSMKHEQAHLVRAVMEGVVFNLYECMKIMDSIEIKRDRLIAAGGGAKAQTWRQIQADVFNMPVYTTNSTEEACTGAIITAAVGTGAYASIEEACRAMVSVKDTPIMPITEHISYYQERQQRFIELYEHVKSYF